MPDINDVQIEISETTKDLLHKIDQLGQSVSDSVSSFSIIEQVKSRPALALSLAVVSGVIVGQTLSKSSSRRQMVDGVITPLASAVLAKFLSHQIQS